jgi:hypothetical protein
MLTKLGLYRRKLNSIVLKRSISLTIAIVIIAQVATIAQSYNSTFGLRLGDNFGFTAAQRITNHTTVEAIGSDGLFSDTKYVSIAVKQHHAMLTRRFNFFLGGGYYAAQPIIYNRNDSGESNPYRHGIMGTMGAELTIGRINVSLDYMPHYILDKTYNGKNLNVDSALSIRYVLWSRESSMRKFFKKVFRKKK